MKASTRQHVLFLLALILLSALLYSSGYGNFFYNDDFHLVYSVKHRTVTDIVVGHYPEDHFWKLQTPYWRPGWHLLFKATHLIAGLEPVFYVAVGIVLHIATVLLIYVFVTRAGSRPLTGLIAAGIFASSPVYAEAVLWPSASFNVIPAAILELFAVFSALRFAELPRARAYILCFALFALSLTFKEAAYNFPFIFATAFIVMEKRPFTLTKACKTVLYTAPFLATVFFHYLFLNRFSISGSSILETISNSFHWTSEYFRRTFQVQGISDPEAFFYAGIAFVFLFFAFPEKRARVLLVWCVLSVFPFAARDYASRFSYFCHVPVALFLGSVLLALSTKKTLTGKLYAPLCLLLTGLGCANMVMVPEEIDRITLKGEQCRSILKGFESSGYGNEKEFYVDSIHPALTNGFAEMLYLFLGKKVQVKNLTMLNVPPFLLYGDPRFDSLEPGTVVLRLGQSGAEAVAGAPPLPAYTRMTKAELVEDRLVLPMFGFRYSYEVLPPRSALKKIVQRGLDLEKTVIINKKPSILIEPPGNDGTASIDHIHMVTSRKVVVNVTCPYPCLFLLCLPVKLDTPKAKVLINGHHTVPFRANGRFNAIELKKGRHRIVASFP